MEGESVKIEKLLCADQWVLWKFQVKILLNASELWEVVSGEEGMPIKAQGQAQEDFDRKLKEWKKQDRKAQKVIATSIGQQPLMHIANCTTAHAMWSKLQSVYEMKSQTNIHMLQQKYYSFSKDETDGLETLVQQLRDLGEAIPETMVVTKILITLPTVYNHFYSA